MVLLTRKYSSMSISLATIKNMKLYDYYRSSASYRVRIALHYKKVPYELEHINLVEGSHLEDEFSGKNPQKLLPLLEDGKIQINQSLAILEYLEEKFPEPPLLPKALKDKLAVKALALEIACEIHPLNNLRVLKYLKNDLNLNDLQKQSWYHHWLKEGFSSIETRIEGTHGEYCFGGSPTWADLLLIPQMYNAYRFEFPMEHFPILTKIYSHCMKQDFFIKASPEERIKEIN